MAGQTPHGDDPAFQSAWAELLQQIRTANTPDAAFWAALKEDVAASDSACDALAAAWAEADGAWPIAMPRYRWWMQDHADLFPTVNAIAVEMALAKLEGKKAKGSARRAAKSPSTKMH